MDGLLKMQHDFAALSTYLMQGLATIPSPTPKRRKQRTPSDDADDVLMARDDMTRIESPTTMAIDAEEVEDDPIFPTLPRNLETVFNQLPNEHVRTAVTSPLPASPQQPPRDSSSPNNANTPSTEEPTTQPSLAPLNPRNNDNTGSAGANIK